MGNNCDIIYICICIWEVELVSFPSNLYNLINRGQSNHNLSWLIEWLVMAKMIAKMLLTRRALVPMKGPAQAINFVACPPAYAYRTQNSQEQLFMLISLHFKIGMEMRWPAGLRWWKWWAQIRVHRPSKSMPKRPFPLQQWALHFSRKSILCLLNQFNV